MDEPMHPADGSGPPARPNGLCARPAMGWNSWNAFRTRIDEQVIARNAERLVSSGLAAAGYEYVVIDDGWQAGRRDASGRLVSDPVRFPSGIAALVDHIHALGLKAGLYACPGAQTCAMLYDDYPGEGLGSHGHERDDIELFASWGIDYLKYDWCEAERSGLMWREKAFEKMAGFIAATGRDIVYSISEYGQHEPWRWAPAFANSWRTTPDIAASFGSVVGILNRQRGLEAFSGPGHWNDPDMLQVGNPGLDERESRAHFALWAMLASPLMAGNDLRTMPEWVVDVLGHRGVIAIDQDPLGRAAVHRLATPSVQVLDRPLAGGHRAWAVLNTTDDTDVHVRLDADGLTVQGTDGEHRLGAAASGAWLDVWTGRETDALLLQPHELGLLRVADATVAADTAAGLP